MSVRKDLSTNYNRSTIVLRSVVTCYGCKYAKTNILRSYYEDETLPFLRSTVFGPFKTTYSTFLNQECSSQRLARSWFLKIDIVRTLVCIHVCVRLRAIKNYSLEISQNSQSNKSYCLSVSLYGTCYQYC